MGRRIRRRWDLDRAELLGQPELSVERGKGDPNYFYGWNLDPDVDACPLCGCKVIKIQDLFSKTYKDIIDDNGKTRVVSLEYGFHKWRCLNNQCRHIFAKEIEFASKYDNVTYRLEEEVAARVMSGHTYGEIYNQLQGSISRQAVGQIFNRWVRKKEELRKLQSTPSRLAIVSAATEKDRCVLFLNLDDGSRILDVLYGINSADIAAVIRKLDTAKVKTIITDCEEIIVAAAKDYFPAAIHIIPVEFWFRLVRADFEAFSHEVLKWCAVRGKDYKIMIPKAVLGPMVADLQPIFDARPSIQQPYEDYNTLQEIISNRGELWVYDELLEWCASVGSEFADWLSVTIMRLQLYRQEIENHVHYREEVPEPLSRLVDILEIDLKSERFFSTEAIKAKLLYGVQADLQHWTGIPMGDVLEYLSKE
ncbi:MAG: transposase [Bacteroidaceae bacterium]|nr:transposase [Bacteroidaceae bacterium]